VKALEAQALRVETWSFRVWDKGRDAGLACPPLASYGALVLVRDTTLLTSRPPPAAHDDALPTRQPLLAHLTTFLETRIARCRMRVSPALGNMDDMNDMNNTVQKVGR